MIEYNCIVRGIRSLILVLFCLLCNLILAQPILHVELPSVDLNMSFKCLSVRLATNKTIITNRFKASNKSNTFWVNRGCYLQTFDSPRKYNLLYIKNASYEKNTAKIIQGSCIYTQVFEPLPANCTRFKLCESDGSYETYDLNSWLGRKIIYSNNVTSNNFKRIAEAFSNLINNNSKVIKIATEKTTDQKIGKIEIAINYPMLTFVCRYGNNSTEWAHEYTFNVNDVQIEEYAFDSGNLIYAINSGSGIVNNNLNTSFNYEDYMSDIQNHYKSLIIDSEDPILNRRIGNAILALIKTSRYPSAEVSTDFDKTPSDMTFIKKNMGNSNTAPIRTSNKTKNRTTNRPVNRVPALKKTK